jgi:hypothetical protein
MPNPTSIAGCELWFDATDTATITKVGGLVSQWNDKSGNVNNVTQATGADQPNWTLASINTQPAVIFNGSEFLANVAATGLPQGTAASSIFSVMESTSQPSFPFLVSWGSSGGDFSLAFNDGALAGIGARSTNANAYATALLNTSPHVLSAIFTGPALPTNYLQYLDGTAQALTTGELGNVTISGNALSIGSLVGGGSFGWVGPIGEIIVYNSALGMANQQTLEGYLAWKWGLQANLPVSHPYFNAPPPGWLGGGSAIGNQASPGGATGNGAQSTGAVGNGPSATAIGNG